MTSAFHVGLLPDRPIDELVDLVVYAEELGFDGAWVADSQIVFRDGYAAIALAAARTTRIKLATGVTNPVTRHPSVLAGAFATLDELSGGRMIIGIGVGESSVHTVGLRPARLKRLEEVAVALRQLTRGEEADFDGRPIHIPWARRNVPLFIAASGPKSLQLAGRIADGVLFQVGALPSSVRYAMRNVEIGRDLGSRGRGESRLLCRLACSVAEDGVWARAQVRGYVAAAAGTTFASVPHEELPDDLAEDLRLMKERYDYYEHASIAAGHADLVTDRIVDGISISGTPEEVVPRFRELIDLGIDGFVIPITGTDPRLSMRVLAERVIPALG
jgi:5,10-methylenetetrahydromethanopterin reductase